MSDHWVQEVVREQGMCGGMVDADRICIKDSGHAGPCGVTEHPDHSELRRLAEEATPGPWDADYVCGAVRHIVRNVDSDAFVGESEFAWDRYKDGPFIAAANPQVVLHLLDDLARLKGLLREARDEWVDDVVGADLVGRIDAELSR